MFQNAPNSELIIWLTFISDIIKTIAPVIALIISFVNLLFVVWTFKYKDKKENQDKDRSRNIDWYKKLIIDPNLTHFYDFFDNLETEYKKLTPANCPEKTKRSVESATLQHQIKLRRSFIDVLSVADNSLHQFVEEEVDELIGEINKSIFDGGINLSHKPKFEETILKPISDTRIKILKKMFEYTGENDNKLLKP